MKYFDFSGFSRDWLSPQKEYRIDNTGNLSLSDIAKDMFQNILLPKKYHKMVQKFVSNANDLNSSPYLASQFFILLNNKKIDPGIQMAIIRFVQFGRKIYAMRHLNQMGSQQIAKMMAPCFVHLFFEHKLPASDIRKYSMIFQNVLDYCFPLCSEDFTRLISIDKKAVSTKAKLHELLQQMNFGPKDKSEPCSSTDHSSSCSSSMSVSIDTGSAAPSVLFSSCTPESDVFSLAKVGNIEELRRFFQNIPDAAEFINENATLFGRKLLHVAVLFQQPAVIQLLTEFGARIHVADKHGRTPLHYAASWGSYGKPCDILTLTKLFEMPGAKLAAKIRKDVFGKSAIDIANESDIISAFREYLASTSTLDKSCGSMTIAR